MATHRLLHVTRTGNDTDGLAEFTDSDTILLPIHTSDPSGTTEGEMIYNETEDKIKIYDGSAWQVVGNTTEQIQDIVGAMFSGNTESNITVDYQDSDGTIDLTVAAQDSTAIVDGDSDTKIQVDEGGVDEDKIRYDVAGTEVAVQDAGGIALTTNGGMFRHNQTQAATFTIPSGEGTIISRTSNYYWNSNK
jgi:hypothetical protein